MKYSPTDHVRFGRVRKRYVALIVALLLVSWFGWWIYSGLTIKSGPFVDFVPQLVALSEKYQATDGENGWPALYDALERFGNVGTPNTEDWPVDADETWAITRFDRFHKGPFDAERLKFELAYLTFLQQSGTLDEIKANLDARRFVRTRFDGAEDGLLMIWLPDIHWTRGASNTLCASMRVSAESDDFHSLVDALETIIGLSRSRSYEPNLISMLVAVRTLEAALDELAMSMVEQEFDGESCDRLLSLLSNDVLLAPLQLAIEAERISCYDMIQRVHNSGGMVILSELEKHVSTGSPVGGTANVLTPSNLRALTMPRRWETTSIIDLYFDALVEQADMTRSERIRQAIEIDTFVEAHHLDNVVVRVLVPAMGRTLSMRDEFEQKISATRVLLAIEKYEAQERELPKSLEALVLECLTEIPADVISEQPFVYLRRDATVDDPRLFLFYSVGADGVDNSGVERGHGELRDAAEALQSGSRGDGFDYVFNRLREPMEEE